jgi:hypothetical protein
MAKFWGQGVEFETIDGKYITNTKAELTFSASLTGDIATITIGGGQSVGFSKAFGTPFTAHVTKESFKKFKEQVLNKDVPWTNIQQIKEVASVPGTWLTNTKADAIDEETSRANAQASISGTYPESQKAFGGVSSKKSKRNRRSTRRKSTKLRRSRRNVNRKTKN